MALTLTYSQPAFPKDTVFDIVGIGAVPNGSKITLTEEQERGYVIVNGVSIQDANKDSDALKIEGTPLLKTTDDVFKLDDTPPVVVSETAAVGTVNDTTEDKDKSKTEGGEV